MSISIKKEKKVMLILRIATGDSDRSILWGDNRRRRSGSERQRTCANHRKLKPPNIACERVSESKLNEQPKNKKPDSILNDPTIPPYFSLVPAPTTLLKH